MNKISIGDKFYRWTVISLDAIKRWHVVCRCKCGTTREVIKANLNNGASMSCGCIAAEINRDRMLKHGRASRKDPLYNVWSNMKARCSNKNHQCYAYYGGRGIKVCRDWDKDFLAFERDMGKYQKNKTIERINNNDGYYKENCRWASHLSQSRNTRKSKIWHIGDRSFKSLPHAAVFFNKRNSTIKGWCDGYTVKGKYYPPKVNCWSELLY